MSLTALTPDQYAHFQEAWRLFDTDGDGLVTPTDMQKLLRSFGYEHSVEELQVYLDDLPVCVEKDRCLDQPEFYLWALKLAETIEQVVLPICTQACVCFFFCFPFRLFLLTHGLPKQEDRAKSLKYEAGSSHHVLLHPALGTFSVALETTCCSVTTP